MKSTIFDKIMAKNPGLANLVFSIILFGLDLLIKLRAFQFPAFRKRLKEKNFCAQIKVQDNSAGRYYTFSKGKVISRAGIHPNPDICLSFRTAALAVQVLLPPRDQLVMINAMKTFQLALDGPDELTVWFMGTLSLMMTLGTQYGLRVRNGETRYASNSNGGPVFVYVKDGKIIRITPIDFDDSDAASWTIRAREKHLLLPARQQRRPIPWHGNPPSIRLTGCSTQ